MEENELPGIEQRGRFPGVVTDQHRAAADDARGGRPLRTSYAQLVPDEFERTVNSPSRHVVDVDDIPALVRSVTAAKVQTRSRPKHEDDVLDGLVGAIGSRALNGYPNRALTRPVNRPPGNLADVGKLATFDRGRLLRGLRGCGADHADNGGVLVEARRMRELANIGGTDKHCYGGDSS